MWANLLFATKVYVKHFAMEEKSLTELEVSKSLLLFLSFTSA